MKLLIFLFFLSSYLFSIEKNTSPADYKTLHKEKYNRLTGTVTTEDEVFRGTLAIFYKITKNSSIKQAYTINDIIDIVDNYSVPRYYIFKYISEIENLEYQSSLSVSTNELSEKSQKYNNKIMIKYKEQLIDLPVKIKKIIIHSPEKNIILTNFINIAFDREIEKFNKNLKITEHQKSGIYIKNIKASSVYPYDPGGPYYPKMAIDKDRTTAWQSFKTLPGNIWLMLELNRETEIEYLTINGSIGNPTYYESNPRIERFRLTLDNKIYGSYKLADKNTEQKIVISSPKTKTIKIEILTIYHSKTSRIYQPSIAEISLYYKDDTGIKKIPVALQKY